MELKDQDIMRLTKEVAELRLYKAPLVVSQIRTDSTDNAVTVQSHDETDGKETSLKEQLSGDATQDSKDVASDHEALETSSLTLLENINTTSDLPPSLADSGHFEDMTSFSVSELVLWFVFQYITNSALYYAHTSFHNMHLFIFLTINVLLSCKSIYNFLNGFVVCTLKNRKRIIFLARNLERKL